MKQHKDITELWKFWVLRFLIDSIAHTDKYVEDEQGKLSRLVYGARMGTKSECFLRLLVWEASLVW